MLLLSLLELAFGQLFFNHMCASVSVPVWDCSCYLMETFVIRLKHMSSHASLVIVRAGLRPALFLSHVCLCLCTCLGLFFLSDWGYCHQIKKSVYAMGSACDDSLRVSWYTWNDWQSLIFILFQAFQTKLQVLYRRFHLFKRFQWIW